MTTGYSVEYSADGNEICIIPKLTIPFYDFDAIVKAYRKLGYIWWLPADERRGYRFSKCAKKEADFDE